MADFEYISVEALPELDNPEGADIAPVIKDGKAYRLPVSLINAQTANVTFEVLNINGDVGSGAGQLAPGNHDHEIGDMNVLFENQLI